MATALMTCIAMYCAFRWFLQYINTATMLWYMEKKKIPMPEAEDIREGTKWVTERIADDLFPWRKKS